jgi:uncharacterized protein YdeI (YjbR/CyaY-like superfamily)
VKKILAQSREDAKNFSGPEAWASWLSENHASSPGIWVRIAKKNSGVASVSYGEALDEALCYGWIDGQKKGESADAWLQRFCPRGKKSIWSKINRGKALALIENGRMRPAGLAEIDRAKEDRRWDDAYDSPEGSAVPEDFQLALDGNARAGDFFSTLDRANRYAVLFRIQTAKKAETRARRIRQFVEMLERHEKLHP